MTSLYLRAFLPRSRTFVGLTLFVWLSALWLAPVVEWVSETSVPWLAQYMAVAVMVMLGVSIGNSLGAIRRWPGAILVPGLMTRFVASALAVSVSAWLLVLVFLLAGDRTNQYALTMSLGAGLVAMMLGAGVHKPLAFPLVVVATAVLVIADFRAGLVLFIERPIAEAVFMLAGAAAWLEVRRIFKQPLDSETATTLDRMHVDRQDPELVQMTRYSTMLPLARTSAIQALNLVIEHGRRQAWLNDVIAFALFNGLAVAALLPGLRGDADDAYAASALLTAILIITLPLTYRSRFSASQETLWLTGVAPDRTTLGRQGFLALMRTPLRVTLLGCLALALFHDVPQRMEVVPLAFALVLTATGTSAVMLLTALVFQPRAELPGSVTPVFSVSLVLIFIAGGWFAAFLSVSLELGLLIPVAVLYSAAAVLATVLIYSRWFARRDFG